MEVLKKDMGQTPAVGWNVSPTYGPIYLFQERRDRKRMKTTTYFVTANGILVAFTRC